MDALIVDFADIPSILAIVSEAQHERRPSLQRANVTHATAHAVHQLTYDGQSDSIAAFSCAEERQKDLTLQSRGHAGSVVANDDLQTPTSALTALHPQSRRGLIRGCLFRILNQSQQHLLELPFVGEQTQAR